jgi:hypothetical protein
LSSPSLVYTEIFGQLASQLKTYNAAPALTSIKNSSRNAFGPIFRASNRTTQRSGATELGFKQSTSRPDPLMGLSGWSERYCASAISLRQKLKSAA